MALLELFSDNDEGGKVNSEASRDNGPGGVVYSSVEANLQMISFIYLTLRSKEFLTIYLSPILLFSPIFFFKQEKDFPPILNLIYQIICSHNYLWRLLQEAEPKHSAFFHKRL